MVHRRFLGGRPPHGDRELQLLRALLGPRPQLPKYQIALSLRLNSPSSQRP